MVPKDFQNILILVEEENNLFAIRPEELMAAKKGTVPSHVKKKHFVHPGLEYPFIQVLEEINDPRGP
jgi:hypothetical protein